MFDFKVTLKEVGSHAFTIGQTRVTPVPVTHTDRQHCLGYRIEYQGKSLAYSGDATYNPNLIQLCRNVDLAVLDCSFPKNRQGIAHMHAGECGQVAQQAGVKHLVLSHFYPVAERYDLKKQAAQAFGGKITRARERDDHDGITRVPRHLKKKEADHIFFIRFDIDG